MLDNQQKRKLILIIYFTRMGVRVIALTKEEAGREALKIIHRDYPNLEPRSPAEIIHEKDFKRQGVK